MIAGADEAGLITMIRSGLDEKSSMPAFEKTLTPDQVRDILSYLREASSR